MAQPKRHSREARAVKVTLAVQNNSAAAKAATAASEAKLENRTVQMVAIDHLKAAEGLLVAIPATHQETKEAENQRVIEATEATEANHKKRLSSLESLFFVYLLRKLELELRQLSR
jgi:hypothetical protein